MKVLSHALILAGLTALIFGCGSSKSTTSDSAPPTGVGGPGDFPGSFEGGGFEQPSVENYDKLTKTIDGNASDWQDVEPVWEEGGAAGVGNNENGVDIKQVYFDNDEHFLYVFFRTTPTVQARFDKKPSSGYLGDIYFDTDNDPSTGCKGVSGHDYGDIDGYEFRLWVPLGIRSGSSGEQPFVNYRLRTVDEADGGFALSAIASSKSLDQQPLIAHGEEGVELAVPMKPMDLEPGANVRLLLMEAVTMFDKERYSEGSYSVK